MYKIKISVLLSGLLFTVINLEAVCANNVSMGSHAITTSATKFNDNDLVSKKYVDETIGQLQKQLNNQIVQDHEGWIHPTIKIGTQLWMADNMYVNTHSKDGSLIKHNSETWNDNNYDKMSYPSTANYGNYPNTEDTQNSIRRIKFGNLYQWNAVASDKIKEICPLHWHLPTYKDWATLISFVNNNSLELKVGGSSGFNAIFTGVRISKDNWESRGISTTFWSSTSKSDTEAWSIMINVNNNTITKKLSKKDQGFSVRCIKDK